MNKYNQNTKKSRQTEAASLARTLLSELESEDLPVERYLMKAMGVARLLRDSDALSWLTFELRGYPKGFHFSNLGSCEKYARLGGRITEENTYWLGSLPEFEAITISDKISLQNSSGPKPTTTSIKNYVEAGATQQVLNSQLAALATIKNNYRKNAAILASLKTAIHAFVSDCYIALELGDIAQDIFGDARESVEKFIRAECPKAAEKLISVTDRMQENNDESRTSALTSCRRLLMDVADAVFPPSETDWKDRSGKMRKVGSENYKNRILAFIEQKIMTSETILSSEIEHLASRLDAVYQKNCKGVHTNVGLDEARLAVITTYLIIAEIAKLKNPINE